MQNIRRIIGRSEGNSNDWNLDQELELEEETEEDVKDEHQESQAVSHQPVHPEASGDHYVDMVKAALSDEGNIGRYHISIYWLRTILAGFEGRGDGLEDILQTANLAPDYPGPAA